MLVTDVEPDVVTLVDAVDVCVDDGEVTSQSRNVPADRAFTTLFNASAKESALSADANTLLATQLIDEPKSTREN